MPGRVSSIGRGIAVVLATVAGMSPATMRAQQPSDTARYVVLFTGRPAGAYREWWSGGALHSVFEYNDRGRGPHLEAVMRMGTAGVPIELSVLGHGYFKDTLQERFTNSAGTASWTSTNEHGTRSNAGDAFYAGATESPTGMLQLVRAALAAGGRLPLLPSGEARAARVGDLTIQVNGTPRRVIQYDVGGFGFSPVPVWLDERGERFALVSSWSSTVPEGWEAAIPAMIAAQERERDARYLRLARDLAHRPAGALVIRNARLFVAESATVRPRTTVVVEGDRITAVGRDGAVKTPAGAQVIDAAGKMLLPGLWDMHVHIGRGDDGLLHIAGGVTSARDMGNDTISALALQRQFASDSLIGPRLHLAGIIDGSGPFQAPTGMLADDEATARAHVDWYAAHGYEQIKIYSSTKPELVPAIIAQAHAKGLRVSGHVPAFMTAEQVVRLGFDEVQHANMLMLNFLDSVKDTRSMARFTAVAQHGAELDFGSERVRGFVALLRERGTVIDPTLVTFEGMFNARPGALDPSQAAIADRMPSQVRRGFYSGGLPVPEGLDQRYRDSYRAMMRMVKAMYDAGVPVVAGTDAGPVGFALHRELELYVDAGIPAPSVLRLATLGAARVMRRDRESGSVAVGKVADLVLVDGDPSTRISDIRRTSLVVKNGILYRPAELYEALGIRP